MTASRWYYLVAFALLSSCARAEFHGDVRFSPEERTAIESGIAFASAKTGTEAPEVIWDGDGRCEYGAIVRGSPAAGFCRHTCIEIAPAPAPRLAAVTAHEVAHWNGLRHHAGPGLMNEAGAPELVWTDEDERACKRKPSGLCTYEGRP